MTTMDFADLARRLDDAERQRRPIPRLTATTPLDLAGAAAIQHQLLTRRQLRGESLIGLKLGFTSRAKMLQMGVDDLIYGHLTNAMLVEDAAAVDIGRFIHPRIEPEIAFLFECRPDGVATVMDAVHAVAAVAVAYEIVDSRFEDFRFEVTDVVADNASAAAFGIGPWHRAGTVDVGNLGMLLEINGRPAAVGSSAAILGHPLRAVTAAARLAATTGIELPGGFVLLAGAATAAVPLPRRGHVRAVAASLGHAEVTVT